MNRPDPHGVCLAAETRTRRRFRTLSVWCAVALLCLLPRVVSARPDAGPVNPRAVEAAFLRNFAHYVTWPPQAFPDASSPWQIGVLGDDALGDVIEKTCKDRTEQGRGFVVLRAETPEALPACQIVFVAYKDPAKRRDALARWKGRPVLTVGDAPEFLQEGGVIRFRISNRVEMSINLDQARAVSLNIQTQMLEVAREVLENGAVSKLR